jgi:hypothetical protein
MRDASTLQWRWWAGCFLSKENAFRKEQPLHLTSFPGPVQLTSAAEAVLDTVTLARLANPQRGRVIFIETNTRHPTDWSG